MARWGFEPILDSYWLVTALVAGLFVLLAIIRPSLPAAQVRRLRVLHLLRAAAIVMLTFAMLRPVHVSTQSRPQSASLLVVFDQSRSMSISDGSDNQSRWSQMQRTLQASRQALTAIQEKWAIELLGFDQQLAATPIPLDLKTMPARPLGEQTNVSGALEDVMRRHAGQRVAGVILLSDGAQRVATPRGDAQQVARELNRLGVPLFVVPFGKPRSESQARDVAVERLQDHYTIFAKNEVDIRAAIRVQGYVNQPIPVEATLEGPADGKRRSLGKLDLNAAQDDALLDAKFRMEIDTPGEYTLRIESPQQPGELVTANNQLTAYVKVLEGGIKVLYIEGNLVGAEQQIVRRSLAASPDVELDFRPVDRRLQDQWPLRLAETRPLDNYDIVMIGDVPMEALGGDQLKSIAEFVARGKGLMLLGGLQSFGPGGYGQDQAAAFAAALPVGMRRLERQPIDPNAPIRADVHIAGPLTLVPTRAHFVTQLFANAEQNAAAWRSLPPLLGANRFASVQPRALRLLETPQGDPVLVAWPYNQGRVLVFAGDSTHRWWRRGFADLHKRFWRQSMLWLANQDQLLRRDVWIQLDRHRYQPEESVEFSAGARDETGSVPAALELSAELLKGEAKPVPVRMHSVETDWRGTFSAPTLPGDYVVRVTARSQGKVIGTTTGRLQIQSRDLELADPAANPEQLAALAKLTEGAGGRVVPPETLPQLLEELQHRPVVMEIEAESRWRFGDRALDVWPFFLAFVGLLAGEWTLRKRWGLQ